MKNCSKCNIEKEITDFPKVGYRKDGSIMYRTHCKKCEKKRVKNWSNKEPLYKVWKSMITRCENADHKTYKNYGKKGIKVSKKWRSYKKFKEDMISEYLIHKDKNRYTTLDRINPRGDYCKENCRWATMKEQQNNRTNNRYFEFNGMRKTLTEWANYLGVKRSRLSQRYYMYKWPIEKTLTFNL